ncbi:MAG: tRNA uridine-5-carboxymethylaminomethyl(34) synthesis GTPase MnmE [Firmicutes bacterium]|jgi:tRNA modification GTPase|nr:tRNA uridine-5-carboxymethylaminomethyl(34) synthesis GTPase MnmE [Bacillota bacterium]
MTEYTIAAVATAIGEAGIGIVRLSGADAIDIGDRMFEPKRGGRLRDLPTYRLKYGRVVDPSNGRMIDEAIVLVMRGPHSYTGEDVVEFQCHGGVVAVKKVLETALQLGAKMAQPGEFTKRAFLNGRLDLTQAEAVMDIVQSKTDVGLNVAVDQLEGSLSRRIGEIRERLYHIVVQVEAAVEFPEDDVPDVDLDWMESTIQAGIDELDHLIASADDGKILREGLKTVITGKPNVGKSSLLNRLLDENRALVTDIPGTTRDTIEEVINLRGIPLRLIDTAGIRESGDVVERLGVERAVKLWDEADLILHVLDRSVPLEEEDYKILEHTKTKRRILLINKADLPAVWDISELGNLDDVQVLEISLVEGDLTTLIDCIVEYAGSGALERSKSQSGIVTRARHKQSLIEAHSALNQALTTLQMGYPLDLISIDLQNALEHLGEITGETVRENVIDRIFSQFCIGK